MGVGGMCCWGDKTGERILGRSWQPFFFFFKWMTLIIAFQIRDLDFAL